MLFLLWDFIRHRIGLEGKTAGKSFVRAWSRRQLPSGIMKKRVNGENIREGGSVEVERMDDDNSRHEPVEQKDRIGESAQEADELSHPCRLASPLRAAADERGFDRASPPQPQPPRPGTPPRVPEHEPTSRRHTPFSVADILDPKKFVGVVKPKVWNPWSSHNKPKDIEENKNIKNNDGESGNHRGKNHIFIISS